MDVSPRKSNENASESDAARAPAVTTTPRVARTPRVLRASTDDSDFHSVISHAVPPSRACALGCILAPPVPVRVRVSPPAGAPFLSWCWGLEVYEWLFGIKCLGLGFRVCFSVRVRVSPPAGVPFLSCDTVSVLGFGSLRIAVWGSVFGFWV